MLKAPARKVRRVTDLLKAQNEYDAEQMEQQRAELEEAKRKNKSNANNPRR